MEQKIRFSPSQQPEELAHHHRRHHHHRQGGGGVQCQVQPLGAAGAVEAIFTALALRDGFLPATLNYQVPDPACDLDVVPNQGRQADICYALSNSLGFGGHNGTLLFKKWEV